jgi:E3 ubiquitin-protein ligase HERC2
VDVTKTTFEHLDALIRRVIEDLDGSRDWPPPAQEKECVAVAALNLLRLQVEFYSYSLHSKNTLVKIFLANLKLTIMA